jgi:hypothetical protein
MRPALILAAAAAALGALAPAAAQAEDPKTTLDIRCVIVGGALAESTDPDMQSLGRASLFYFMGRIEGRGDTDNLDARIVDVASKMTADDLKTESQTCGAMFTAATQNLQELSNAFQQHFGDKAAPPPK